MKIEQLAKIKEGGQDGAIYGSELFRFNHKGDCCVYDISALSNGTAETIHPIAEFKLELADIIVPHSNAV